MISETLARMISSWDAEEAVLQLVCDLDEATGRPGGGGGGARCHETEFRRAVDRTDVDAVIIAVPPGLHRDITVAAAAARKHVPLP